MKNIKDILQKNDLVRTSCREEIIRIFTSSSEPQSEEEIKATVNKNFDRTTIYRTFKTLIKKEIIHKIVIDNTIVKYALSKPEGSQNHHAHFFCVKCQKAFCLPSVVWQYSKLPEEYTATETELIIKGYCKNCR